MPDKLKSILFNASMARSVREDRKTQTRRIVGAGNSTVNGMRPNQQRSAAWFFDGWRGLDWSQAWVDGAAVRLEGEQAINIFGVGRNEGYSCGEYLHVPCPPDHGGSYRVHSRIEPGDILAVGEPWRAPLSYDDLKPSELPEDCPIVFERELPLRDNRGLTAWGRLRHGRSLPFRFRRTRLEVLSVRAERLQEISEEDAVKEGLPMQLGGGTGRGPGYKWDGPGYHDCVSRTKSGAPTFHVAEGETCRCIEGRRLKLTLARCAFRKLWESIHGPGSWEADRWVWAIAFRRTA